jgi:UDP-N-acetyl-D-galactosamine dehydrogenase
MNLESVKIAVIGLGYVGLPLAVEFGKKYDVLGFDINQARVDELLRGHDSTLEVSDTELALSTQLTYSYDKADLADANIYFVTVPTPIDESKAPDLTPLQKASEMIGAVVKKGDIVIYESTVYPGATEEICLPIIEKVSGLMFNKDFFAGYSPERINPGDKVNTLTKIMKITSGSTPEVADFIDYLYGSIITAGTHKTSSIKVAEAAKVIENTQRDVNIALINELAIIFNKLEIDTQEVLDAAGTKWNFMPFRPGLVGGHCIGVDPYYLTHKAQSVGYFPDIILSSRKLNDGMGAYVANQLVCAMLKKRIQVYGSKVLIMGLSFKENCPDIRNTRIIDIINSLKEYDICVDITDPWCEKYNVMKEFGIDLVEPKSGEYDAIVIAVSHDQFKSLEPNIIRGYGKKSHVLYDLKYVLEKSNSDIRL